MADPEPDLICVSPIDGREYARRTPHSDTAVSAIIEQARRAQRDWARVPLEQRCGIVGQFVGAMEAHNPEIVAELAWQMGRPVRFGGELRSLKERVEGMLALAQSSLADEMVEDSSDARRRVVREPVGLVLVIAPWNYPFLTAANTIIPALVAGNAVLLKHAAQTLLVGERFAQALAMAGVPDGLFHNLFLSHEQTARLLAAGIAGHATFTGSVESGRAIERAAAGSFTSLTLELGGKDAAYVRADADLTAAVEALVDGAFYNSGQSCCGVERIYVDEQVWQPFLQQFVAQVRDYRLGDPRDTETTLGPMSSARVAEHVRRQTAKAIAAGAKANIERQLFQADQPGSPYLMAQVLTGVDHRMAVMREESFGPVVGLVPVTSEAEAVRLINDSPYGLTGSVWTRDIKAGERITAQLEVGTAFMNRCDTLDAALAWTGVRDSGRGASLGRFGFESVTRPKSLHLRLSP